MPDPLDPSDILRPPRGGMTGRGGQAKHKRGYTLADQVQETMALFAAEVGGKLGEVQMRHRHNVQLTDDAIRFTFEASRSEWPSELPYPWEHDPSGVELALECAREYGGIDGGHHKAWVIDQMCRALLGDRYDEFVRKAKEGEDGPDTYEWDEGIAP